MAIVEYDRAERPDGRSKEPLGWFTRLVMGRVYTENNVLGLITGPTGIGKTYMGLRLCEAFDPKFDSSRICFTALEFLELLPKVPSKGWILWDEPGVYVSHRKWLSEANQAIQFVVQSFRYKFINVFFALPSKFFLDKVPREMCHYELVMKRRGEAGVYRIIKSSFYDVTYTKFLGNVYSTLPSKKLRDAYEKMRREHQDSLYSKLTKKLQIIETKEKAKIEEEMKPKRDFEYILGQARSILEHIYNPRKKTDQGKIDVPLMMRALKIPYSTAYRVRRALLEEIHLMERYKRGEGEGNE